MRSFLADGPAPRHQSRSDADPGRTEAFAPLIPWLAAAGLACMVILGLAFRHRLAGGPGVVALLLACAYLATLALARSRTVFRREAWTRSAVSVACGAITLLWAALLALLAHRADPAEQRLLGFASAALLAHAVSFAIALPLALGLVLLALTAMLEIGQAGGHAGAYAGLIAVCAVAALLALRRLDRLRDEIRRMTLRLRRQDRTIEALHGEFEALDGEWLWEFDRDNGLRTVSQRNGDRPAPALELVRKVDWVRWLADGCHRAEPARHDFQLLARAIETRGGFRELVVPVELAGNERWLSISGRPICDALGRVRFYRGVATDVTAVRDDAVRTRHLARHDWLTGLANRAVFTQAIEAELGRDDRPFHLIVLDLDGFKLINHQHGHEAGDRLLRAVARRIARSVRTGDLVARLHGDQFAVLVPDRSEEFAETCAGRLRARMRDPFSIDMLQLVIGASIGIATGPRDGDTAAALMKAADLALTHAKAAGRGGTSRFSAAMENEARDRRAMLLDLRVAIARQEFSLAFQPIVELASGRTVSAEALMRWSSPQRGSVPPGVFIALAEEAGLIGTLGTWVLERACREAAALPDAIKVAINVSPLQFRDPAFADTVLSAIRRCGIGAGRIVLEVTESVMMAATESTRVTLDTLRAAGVEVALDDFGTGFASLSYLSRFPFDRVKIDRSFVGELAPAGGSLGIVRAIIELAHGLGMGTVAEGVETEAQLAILRELGCTHAQGYLFARPMDAASLGARLSGATA